MSTIANKLERKKAAAPDETRAFSKGKIDVYSVGGTGVGVATFEPGWKWSECVKPIAGTPSCQAAHIGYVLSGRMKVVMDDGAAEEFGPGDLMSIPPGHDAWIVGSDTCRIVDWVAAATYAKK
ncbi:MAG TPA: cupin domain-containing protein [Candidatus Dormibacteraeota bacterium]|nr:cupin domain-containing protein [Candidatus Dormibacteraeota bacterium]